MWHLRAEIAALHATAASSGRHRLATHRRHLRSSARPRSVAGRRAGARRRRRPGRWHRLPVWRPCRRSRAIPTARRRAASSSRNSVATTRRADTSLPRWRLRAPNAGAPPDGAPPRRRSAGHIALAALTAACERSRRRPPSTVGVLQRVVPVLGYLVALLQCGVWCRNTICLSNKGTSPTGRLPCQVKLMRL